MKNASILKWILIVGIVIVLNLFFNFAIKLVYDSPKWEDYCVQKQVTVQPTTQKACVAEGGAWNDQGVATDPRRPEITGWCDLNFTCQKDFTSASEVYNRNVFVALVILGFISLVLGFFLTQSTAVSLGLSLGGVLSLVIGAIRYWSDMDDYLRVIILAVALGALIWLGVKKIKD